MLDGRSRLANEPTHNTELEIFEHNDRREARVATSSSDAHLFLFRQSHVATVLHFNLHPEEMHGYIE